MSAQRSGSARDVFDTKAMLAFAQALLVAPDGGIKVALPPLDDMRFRVVAQTMGATAKRRLVHDSVRGRVCDQLEWAVENQSFSARSLWRSPTTADMAALAAQEET